MKETKIDKLGRIVIPIDFRRRLNLNAGDFVQLRFEDNTVLIKPKNAACKLCNTPIEKHSPIPLCKGCIAKIKAIRE